eukprot:TRINITY_DN22340_c0_g4_i1.p1 TRINITY_DN22340_c0_g4~~TRINITY_DN22340_c0_g4_i1.p1  ORF type:complete len:155 (+),score=20.14 TRINITY_DN22340_c0_g4_i1:112-576(+)
MTRPALFSGSKLLCDDQEALQGWGGALVFSALLLNLIRTTPSPQLQSGTLRFLTGFWALNTVYRVLQFFGGGFSFITAISMFVVNSLMMGLSLAPFFAPEISKKVDEVTGKYSGVSHGSDQYSSEKQYSAVDRGVATGYGATTETGAYGTRREA